MKKYGSRSNSGPNHSQHQNGEPDGQKEAFFLGVDEHFTKTFEVELLQGKNFSGTGDSTSVILNETAAKMLNIQEPSDQFSTNS